MEIMKTFDPGKKSKTNRFLSKAVNKILVKNITKETALLSSLHHFDETIGFCRQKRADRIKNIVSILQLIVPYVHLETLSWGRTYVRSDNKQTDFYTQGLQFVCNRLDMNERTVIRCFKDLVDAGYMKIKRQHAISKEGNVIRHHSLRTFTTKFFRELGFKKSTIDEIINWKRKDEANKIAKSRGVKSFKYKTVSEMLTGSVKRQNATPGQANTTVGNIKKYFPKFSKRREDELLSIASSNYLSVNLS